MLGHTSSFTGCHVGRSCYLQDEWISALSGPPKNAEPSGVRGRKKCIPETGPRNPPSVGERQKQTAATNKERVPNIPQLCSVYLQCLLVFFLHTISHCREILMSA